MMVVSNIQTKPAIFKNFAMLGFYLGILFFYIPVIRLPIKE
jgi:hypothetical protein